MEVFINNKHYIGYKNNYYKIENFTVTIDGKTPLMIALIDKDVTIDKIELLLIDKDVTIDKIESLLIDINTVDNKGNSALIYACTNKNITLEIIKLLLTSGADLYIKNKMNKTALIYAINLHIKYPIIKLLMDKYLDNKEIININLDTLTFENENIGNKIRKYIENINSIIKQNTSIDEEEPDNDE